jgi:hypothetical protein
MAKQSSAGVASVDEAAATAGDGATKKELQQQLDDTRESIAQTVTEIKDTVADQYQSVKDTVSETLDWREQFRRHPAAWSLGALSVGYVIGTSLMASLKDTKHEDQLLKHLAAVSEHFTDELSKRGMDILLPALTGTVLVPLLTNKLNEIFGIDLSHLTEQLLDQGDAKGAASPGKGGKKRKKSGGKKHGKQKGGKHRKADQS